MERLAVSICSFIADGGHADPEGPGWRGDRPAHPLPSVRPRSPFKICLRRQPVSGLCRSTEIMSFLNVRFNSCHLEGPTHIPEPNRGLFWVTHCLGLLGASCYLAVVPSSLWGHVWVWPFLGTADALADVLAD